MKQTDLKSIKRVCLVAVSGKRYVLLEAGTHKKGYAVSEEGRVFALPDFDEMNPELRKDGYTNTNIGGGRCGTHRLVLFAFKGAPLSDDAVCRHLDGNPANNHADNLEWGTWLDNSQDRFKHGTMLKGEKHPNAKLTRTAIASIRKAKKVPGYIRDLAEKFGVHERTIRAVRLGQTWR